MDRKKQKRSGQARALDARDRLILALYAQLKAERETRQALEDAIRHGSLSNEVLTAMASDPVPVITDSDIAEIEHYLDQDLATLAKTSGQERK